LCEEREKASKSLSKVKRISGNLRVMEPADKNKEEVIKGKRNKGRSWE
jgi:rRNA maturation endonuclease Nob1